MHLLEQGDDLPGDEHMQPIGWANIQSPCHHSILSCVLAHDAPASTSMKPAFAALEPPSLAAFLRNTDLVSVFVSKGFAPRSLFMQLSSPPIINRKQKELNTITNTYLLLISSRNATS